MEECIPLVSVMIQTKTWPQVRQQSARCRQSMTRAAMSKPLASAAAIQPGMTEPRWTAIRRFLRPVCHQNLPDTLIPENLRGGRLS